MTSGNTVEELKGQLLEKQTELERVNRDISSIKTKLEKAIIAKTLLGHDTGYVVDLTLKKTATGEVNLFNSVSLPFFQEMNLTGETIPQTEGNENAQGQAEGRYRSGTKKN